jgi:catechol 2,3-dioxygenase-like lactoylglutathione lyase family enzyme
MAFLQLTTIIVKDYDDAIAFFTQALGFELAEASPSRTNLDHSRGLQVRFRLGLW